MIKSGIYMLKNKKTNKVYIGQSINVKKRICQHFSNLRNNRHENRYLQRSFNLNNDSFEAIILVRCPEELLDCFERYYIRKFNAMGNGYNLEDGGNLNKHMSLAARELMKKNHANVKKENNPQFGVKKSEHQKQLQSQAMIGRYVGNKNPMYGKKHSLEVRAKISVNAKQRLGDKNPAWKDGNIEEAIKEYLLCGNYTVAAKKCNIGRNRLSRELKARNLVKNYNANTPEKEVSSDEER